MISHGLKHVINQQLQAINGRHVRHIVKMPDVGFNQFGKVEIF
jgi:hypothetical protein